MPRDRAWVDAPIGFQWSGTNARVDLLANATVNLDNITVVRLLVELWMTPPSLTSTASGLIQAQMGIGVSTNAAFSAGVTSLPDPRVPADAPARGWLWRGDMMYGYNNVDGTEKENWNFPGHTREDLGAMRKVDRGTLFFIFAGTAVVATEVDVDVTGLIRVLCLT